MSNPTARDRRDAFYKWAKDELKLSKSKVLELLKHDGHDSFKPADIPTYKACLKAHVTVRDNLADTMKRIREQDEAVRAALRCPIPGCDGSIMSRGHLEPGWYQTCSEGGDIHPITWNTACLAKKQGNFDGMTEQEVAIVLLDERSKRNAEEETVRG